MNNTDPNHSKKNQFIGKVEAIINELSLENGVEMPDFLIAGYLWDCYESLKNVSFENRNWHRSGTNSESPGVDNE